MAATPKTRSTRKISAQPIITLLTDFGLSDTFVGAMKGVIASIAPQSRVIDICHQITEFDILGGALMLEESYAYFPPGTIHVAIVDPGVGSDRHAVAIQTDKYVFIGPDNGIFELVLKHEKTKHIVRLNNPEYRLVSVSSTFHGRDVFSPAAAHVASGVAIEKMGEPQSSLVHLDLPAPTINEENALEIHILRVDRFGNLITDLTKKFFERWAGSKQAKFDIEGNALVGPKATFSDAAPGEPVAYFGSSGRLEIAINCGRAKDYFGIHEATPILVTHI